MLRGFLVIFILCGIAIWPSLDFVAGKARSRRLEIFPDMVRQMKVRAQAPLEFFCRRTRTTSASRRHGSDWLRDAKTGIAERDACRGQRGYRTLVASAYWF